MMLGRPTLTVPSRLLIGLDYAAIAQKGKEGSAQSTHSSEFYQTAAKGGQRAYGGRLGKDWSPRLLCLLGASVRLGRHSESARFLPAPLRLPEPRLAEVGATDLSHLHHPPADPGRRIAGDARPCGAGGGQVRARGNGGLRPLLHRRRDALLRLRRMPAQGGEAYFALATPISALLRKALRLASRNCLRGGRVAKAASVDPDQCAAAQI
jgi:hypothetical protein